MFASSSLRLRSLWLRDRDEATFFIGRDAESSEAELAGAEQINRLTLQISELRAELLAVALNQSSGGPESREDPPPSQG